MFLPFSERGKAWELKALGLRRLAALGSVDRLDPWVLAAKVGLRVLDGRQRLNSLTREDRLHLLGAGRGSWSGGVYPKPLPDGTYVCILNPLHGRHRNKTTLMEEIAHISLNHQPSGFLLIADGFEVRYYEKSQEEEAYGVGAAALLPWQTFFPALNTGRTIVELAEDYDVTTDLVEYRIKITGAFNVYRARQRPRA